MVSKKIPVETITIKVIKDTAFHLHFFICNSFDIFDYRKLKDLKSLALNLKLYQCLWGNVDVRNLTEDQAVTNDQLTNSDNSSVVESWLSCLKTTRGCWRNFR